MTDNGLPGTSDAMEIDGINISTDLNGLMGEDADLTTPSDYDLLMEKFMQNEITYDEFMRLTGGQTLEEEAQEQSDDDEDDESGDDDEEEEADDEAAISKDDKAAQELISKKTQSRIDELPEHVRSVMGEILDPTVTVSDPNKVKDLQNIATALKKIKTEPESEAKREDKHRAKRIDGLLGQANLVYAKGKEKEALEMLLEVIKQDPRCSEAYRQVANIYQQKNDREHAIQYDLLAAHLDGRTPADEWCRLGDETKALDMLEESSACYARAVRGDPRRWEYYEKRIEMLDHLGLRPAAMRVRLTAAQMVDATVGVTFEWFHDLIKTVAQYYSLINDDDKAIAALEAFVSRSREFHIDFKQQHDTLIGMWITKERYEDAAISILAICDGVSVVDSEGRVCVEVSQVNCVSKVTPFPPPDDTSIVVTEAVPFVTLVQLIMCFIHINEIGHVEKLLSQLLERDLDDSTDVGIVGIGKALSQKGRPTVTKTFFQNVSTKSKITERSDEFWFIFGTVEMTLKNEGEALIALEKVLEINPNHVDGRISLSTLQEKHGFHELALETLQRSDLDLCTSIPDERLLTRQAEIFFERKDMVPFMKTVRLLLAPHFFEVHTAHEGNARATFRKSITANATLKVTCLQTIQGSPLEKLVKRLGGPAVRDGRSLTQLPVTVLHDYCLKLIECLHETGRIEEMGVVCCYSFLQPSIIKDGSGTTFQNLLYYCAVKSQNWPLAFEFIRWFYALSSANMPLLIPTQRDLLVKKIFNAMNFVFANSQNVTYHKYITRALVKCPGNHALQTISGNNSLITGTYRHALREYLRVWNENRKNPLICLLLALTLTHISCKKDLSNRHLVLLRGMAFLKQYVLVRTVTQETHYNIARMFHQINLLNVATHFYKKTLEDTQPIVRKVSMEGEIQEEQSTILTKLAAHNLALIYKNSGSFYLAHEIYEKYLTV